VATSFPSGQTYLEERLREVEHVVADGADEVDMVINRGAFLSGDYQRVFDEIEATKAACGLAHLKVILETGELGSYDQVAKASHLAMDAGADFIKTSTGKVTPAATMPVSLVMLEAARSHYLKTGRQVGFKPAGGIRTAKQAWHYLVMVKETVGDSWLSPDWFRFGASTLLNDVLMQWERLETGHYQSSVYYSLD
jgi:deoxyribose-phosphate aldolase